MAEDSERGLQAAVAACLRCAVIPQGLTEESDFSQAYTVLTYINELAPLAFALMLEDA